MKIIVLGGAGQMSRVTVKDLARSQDVTEVIVADLNEAKARQVAFESGEKCRGVYADAFDKPALVQLITGADCVINGCTYQVNLSVMEACLEAGVHYTDLGGLFHVTRKQMAMDEAFQKSGLTAVLSMGGTPGTINLLARYGVDRLDTVETIRVLNGCGDWTKTSAIFSVPYSMRTIMEEFTVEPVAYLNGEFVAVPPRSGLETIDFPEPLGPIQAHYTLHSEPATFPVAWKEKGLKNVVFKLALPPDFHEKVRFLADLGFSSTEEIQLSNGTSVAPLDVLEAMIRRLPEDPDAKVQDCDILRAEVLGRKNGVETHYTIDSIARENQRYECSSTELNTGVPPSIVAQMIVKGAITRRGAYAAEMGVDPEQYFIELAKRDMYVTVSCQTPVGIDTFTPVEAQRQVRTD
ncbi:saccharopine dehydrogenase family protein [Anoxynatronum buryatiense]|uniref:Saccharopine dehydrogenase, NADP-dependent n=1 Tax=Anoxynatronum buryatiense TaxID=489973 RepID=A0AA45WZ22_9CLOT|nr:saccharopine dehydrogenase NADP-binding domain-containing protein [Anoxynatronum buryatiense]SMP71680.1 Saccharopine dehydrogenase, NADP-dependent [Anoxynatronum buryatiense]